MSVFISERHIQASEELNLMEVAKSVEQNFKAKGYQVYVDQNAETTLISLTKGGIFSKILGLHTALNVTMYPERNGFRAIANAGIFKLQIVPSLITVLLFWPVICTQIVGIVNQAKLDDQVLNAIEETVSSMEHAYLPD